MYVDCKFFSFYKKSRMKNMILHFFIKTISDLIRAHCTTQDSLLKTQNLRTMPALAVWHEKNKENKDNLKCGECIKCLNNVYTILSAQ